jgi:hypothetical protein
MKDLSWHRRITFIALLPDLREQLLAELSGAR